MALPKRTEPLQDHSHLQAEDLAGFGALHLVNLGIQYIGILEAKIYLLINGDQGRNKFELFVPNLAASPRYGVPTRIRIRIAEIVGQSGLILWSSICSSAGTVWGLPEAEPLPPTDSTIKHTVPSRTPFWSIKSVLFITARGI